MRLERAKVELALAYYYEGLTKRLAERDDLGVRLRSFIAPLVLAAIASQLIAVGATRDGVGPFEYTALAALVAFLLFRAYALTRRALRRA